MKQTIKTLLCLTALSFALTSSAEWTPDPNDEMELKVAQAIIAAKESDPGLQSWFDSAAGFAVFPTVGKGGIGIGGAHGKGVVFKGDTIIGDTRLTQLTIGFQWGGQAYSEFIFFKDEAALTNFTRGEFELGAQVSAVAVTAGASADANYSKGVAVFTIAKGGLMYEATVGGQKFNYKAR